MFNKETIIDMINHDLVCMRNRRFMAELSNDVDYKKALWEGYVTAIQVRDSRVDVLNEFGYKPVYVSDNIVGQICIDIVPLDD